MYVQRGEGMTVELHKTVWLAGARHATEQVTQKLLVRAK